MIIGEQNIQNKNNSVIFLNKKWNRTFPLRNFLMKERIRNTCVQWYHKTLQENTKLFRTEHQRKKETESWTIPQKKKRGVGRSDLASQTQLLKSQAVAKPPDRNRLQASCKALFSNHGIPTCSAWPVGPSLHTSTVTLPAIFLPWSHLHAPSCSPHHKLFFIHEYRNTTKSWKSPSLDY